MKDFPLKCAKSVDVFALRNFDFTDVRWDVRAIIFRFSTSILGSVLPEELKKKHEKVLSK